MKYLDHRDPVVATSTSVVCQAEEFSKIGMTTDREKGEQSLTQNLLEKMIEILTNFINKA
jgi:hypothetical protein